MLFVALISQITLSPDTAQVVIQGLIFLGICVQGAITILTHYWDRRDRNRKQNQLLENQSAVSSDIKREVIGTTLLQLEATKRVADEVAEVKDTVKSPPASTPTPTPTAPAPAPAHPTPIEPPFPDEKGS